MQAFETPCAEEIGQKAEREERRKREKRGRDPGLGQRHGTEPGGLRHDQHRREHEPGEVRPVDQGEGDEHQAEDERAVAEVAVDLDRPVAEEEVPRHDGLHEDEGEEDLGDDAMGAADAGP